MAKEEAEKKTCNGGGHDHDSFDDFEQRDNVLRRLYIATFLCMVFLIVEVIGGWLAGSLAVLSDAAHLTADLASFAVAIVASNLARMPSTEHHTFGLRRVESLAALFSMISLAFISVALAYEAIRRLWGNDNQVNGRLMSGIAAIGVVVNIILAFVLGEHHVHLPGMDHGHDHDHDHGHGHSHGHGHGHGHDDDSHSHANDDCQSHGKDDGHSHDHSHGHDHDHGHGHEHGHEAQDHELENGLHNDHHGDHETTVEETVPLAPSSQSVNSYSSLDLPVPKTTAPPRNINLHAAYLHVLGDLAQSVAVLISGIVIWLQPTWRIVDPLCTLLFCAIVFYSTIGVLRSSIRVLLEEVPPSVSWQEVYNAISDVPGVSNVHDLHIWCISHGVPSLSVHCSAEDSQKALSRISKILARSFGINHVTIQIQTPTGTQCVTCTQQCGEGRCSSMAIKPLSGDALDALEEKDDEDVEN